MNPQEENQDTAQSAAYNPFPEPQTIPSGWDTSGLYSTALDAEMDEDVEREAE